MKLLTLLLKLIEVFDNKPLIIRIIVLGFITYVISLLLEKLIFFYGRVIIYWKRRPWLIKGVKNGKKRITIGQNPSFYNSIPLFKSVNARHGIEFTYMLWIKFENWTYRKNKWKHIFHKGSKIEDFNEQNPINIIQTPGLWIHPSSNNFRLFMNTYEDNEYFDIEDFAINTWIHIAIVNKGRKIFFYIDGEIIKDHMLFSPIKLNNNTLYVNSLGGFEGQISNFRYYNIGLQTNEIRKAFKNGHSEKKFKEITL